ncbi:MAG: ABC transporter ATP-binding protein [Acidobacteria bacterium]|nr:ABC transporter ATP-binding protein [Acidobacteriota bacterium]
MLFPIEPYEGVGPIKLGMSINAVREAVGAEVKTFKKSPSSEIPTDAFDLLGVYVYYKPPGICQAVELASPAEPIFQNLPLLGRYFDEVMKWFETMDQGVEVDEFGLTSYKLGIGLYAPPTDDADGKLVESVIIFEKGYYTL